jgi:hypothetical protein
VTPGRVAIGREAVMRQNNCGPETAPFDPDPCVQYTGCMTGYPVVWCEIPILDHTGPWDLSGYAVWQLFASL